MGRVSVKGALLLTLLALLAAGCAGGGEQASDVEVGLGLVPDPPQVGMAGVTVLLTEGDDDPISGATVELEGTMTHAGMVPVFADAEEVGGGLYQAELEFTMGGDWVIIVTVTLPDGSSLEEQFDVPGVTMP